MTYTFSSLTLPAATSGRGGPLSYQIITSIVSGREFNDKIIITQDNLDGLRQEYLDVRNPQNINERLPSVPVGTDFDQVNPPALFSRLLDFPNNDIDERHKWWIVEDLIGHAQDVHNAYNNTGNNLRETAGYRCPCRNRLIQGAVFTSRHQYGEAFDFRQLDAQHNSDSEENCNVWVAAQTLPVGRRPRGDSYLYQVGVGINRNPICPPPTGVNYSRGHLAWPLP